MTTKTDLLAQHDAIQHALDKPEPQITWPAAPMQAGRLRKALDRLYRFNGHVASLGTFLAEIDPLFKRDHIRRYARKKRQGCYAKLATPKHEYSIWYWDAGRNDQIGLDVPKIVFDAFADLEQRDALGQVL